MNTGIERENSDQSFSNFNRQQSLILVGLRQRQNLSFLYDIILPAPGPHVEQHIE
jgi:hypothetical protein